jgi:membrane protein
MTIFSFMAPKKLWRILTRSVADFIDNDMLKLSSSLAYSTIFSLPGLLIIIIWFTTVFYGKEIIEGTIHNQLASFIGENAATNIHNAMKAALTGGTSKIARIIGIGTIVIGATAVFAEIQSSINQIWKIRSKPKKGRGFLRMLINRLLSFSIIISFGFILLVSLLINGAMDLLVDNFMQRFPDAAVIVAYIINLVLSFFIIAIIFGLIFKILPDAKVEWKHVRVGAFTTAFLFLVGKFLISYGAAGTIIIVLLWVYYSSMILYFGAAFTREYAIEMGSRIYPSKYAVWVEQVEVPSNKPLSLTSDAKRRKKRKQNNHSFSPLIFAAYGK